MAETEKRAVRKLDCSLYSVGRSVRLQPGFTKPHPTLLIAASPALSFRTSGSPALNGFCRSITAYNVNNDGRGNLRTNDATRMISGSCGPRALVPRRSPAKLVTSQRCLPATPRCLRRCNLLYTHLQPRMHFHRRPLTHFLTQKNRGRH